jgi:hypothetical protein
MRAEKVSAGFPRCIGFCGGSSRANASTATGARPSPSSAISAFPRRAMSAMPRKKSLVAALQRPWMVRAAAIRARPSGVRGPVLAPPCMRQRPFRIAGLLQGQPRRVLAPQRGAALGLPLGLPLRRGPARGGAFSGCKGFSGGGLAVLAVRGLAGFAAPPVGIAAGDRSLGVRPSEQGGDDGEGREGSGGIGAQQCGGVVRQFV